MRSLPVFFLTLLFASGCSEPKPTATLSYSHMYQQPSAIVVEFKADVDFENLYVENKRQVIVVKKLHCAVGEDQNFDVRHRMQRFFRGDLELLTSSATAGKRMYRYASKGDFYWGSSDGTDRALLRGQALIKALGRRTSIPCKVIMTVYSAAPYYSAPMSIPLNDVLKVAELPAM